MTAYLRVRVRPEDAAAFTVTLRDATERGGILTGIEVNRDGDDVVPAGVDERRHVIGVELVTKRTPLVMDRYTGQLVEHSLELVPDA